MKKAKLTMTGERGFHIEREFDAPRERVWQAMMDSKQLAQWWGRGHRLTVEKNELEKGGHWRFVEHSDHGDFGFEGRYREVKPPERLEITFEFDGMPGHVSVNTMEFVDLGGGRTRIVCDVLFMTGEDRDGMAKSGMEQGMNESYDALDKLLSRLSATR